MRFDVELRQMLRDARLARAGRPLPVRFWHRAAEGVNVAFVTAMSRLIKRRVAPIGGRATGSTRAQGRGPLRLSTVVDDGRHALRRLRSQPGTAMTCVAMLALAIGLSSAM